MFQFILEYSPHKGVLNSKKNPMLTPNIKPKHENDRHSIIYLQISETIGPFDEVGP